MTTTKAQKTAAKTDTNPEIKAEPTFEEALSAQNAAFRYAAQCADDLRVARAMLGLAQTRVDEAKALNDKASKAAMDATNGLLKGLAREQRP